MGIQPSSQARFLSSIKQFYHYCFLENIVTHNPAELYSSPKFQRKPPVVLNLEEINMLLSSMDHSTDLGMRNRAIIEVLYGCGLRVSELCDLKISNVYWQDSVLRVIGKGNKERLVPLGSDAKKYLKIYLEEIRQFIQTKEKHRDIFFLSSRKERLHRVMIFLMIRKTAKHSGIKKSISPHTFRHSFATHLVERGASIRIVQQLLGHESITTTEIYTHLSLVHLRNALEKYHPNF